MSTWLMHVGKEPIYEQVPGVGLFTFMPGKPLRIDDDYMASTILEHKRNLGLVRVPVIQDDRGMLFDTETATENAKQALAAGRMAMVKGYIASCQDRIHAGKPPLPPAPVIQKIIEEDGIDLEAEGINLSGAGFKVSQPVQALMAKIGAMEKAIAQLMEQNQQLQAQQQAKVPPRPTR